jgi:hypothetical protein
MNKIGFTISLFTLMFSFIGICQNNNTYSFKVRNPMSEITIEYEKNDSIFYTDYNNRFVINVSGKNQLGSVILEGGELRKHNNSFIATVKEGTEVVLIVYIVKPNGKMELGSSVKIPIVHLTNPIPYFAGVKPDSIIYKKELLSVNKMHAKLHRFGSTNYLTIVAFDMVILGDAAIDTLSALTGNLTMPMRRNIQSLNPGVPLNFVNIMCRMPSGEIRELDNMQLFVDCSIFNTGSAKRKED